MKRLKLVQDELDIDHVHVYAPHQKRMLRVCTIHLDSLDSIFPNDIADVFIDMEAEALWITSEGPDWVMED